VALARRVLLSLPLVSVLLVEILAGLLMVLRLVLMGPVPSALSLPMEPPAGVATLCNSTEVKNFFFFFPAVVSHPHFPK